MDQKLVVDNSPEYWYVLDLNPEPWAIGPISVIRKKGAYIPFVGRNQQLHTYKEAVQAVLKDMNPVLVEGKVRLTFLFWRQRPDYQTWQARRHRKHEADLTNLVKATEDAIQGVLIGNDRDSVDIGAYMVAQGPDVEGRIIICVQKAPETPDILAMLPEHVYGMMQKHPELLGEPDEYGAGSDVKDFF